MTKSLLRSFVALLKIIIGICTLIKWKIEDFWRPVLGITLVGAGMIALVIVFPYILILYVIVLGAAILRS